MDMTAITNPAPHSQIPRDTPEPARGTQVVSRVAALLTAVGSAAAPCTTMDLSHTTGLTRPTTHRLLTALESEGLLDRTAEGHWVLGPEMYVLGAVASQRFPAQELAAPHLARLALATGESAFLSVRRGNEVVCLARAEGAFPVRSHVLYEGLRLPLGVASAGIAILGHLPPHEVEEVIAQTHDERLALGPQHSDRAVRELVALVRRSGWSLNPGRIVEGSWGLAAAVFDATRKPRYALSLTGIESRFRADRQRELGPLLLEHALQLSTALQRGSVAH